MQDRIFLTAAPQAVKFPVLLVIGAQQLWAASILAVTIPQHGFLKKQAFFGFCFQANFGCENDVFPFAFATCFALLFIMLCCLLLIF